MIGYLARIRSELSRSDSRVSPPSFRQRPSSLIYDKPEMRLISTRYAGLASRNFIIGIRLWPPLRILASSPYCCRKAIASGMVFGRRYSKAGGIILYPLAAFRKQSLQNQGREPEKS